jgi:NADPH:quinone reductase-like Zn-dependent oxidoreductase
MGGMGRAFDGGYAELALLPAGRVMPVRTSLDWPRLGALPESFAAAWGSLDTLDLASDSTLLVRGGSSARGMAATTLAAARGVTVIATTRQPAKAPRLEAVGAGHVVIDDGDIADPVRTIAPDGVDALLELVGPAAMAESLRAVRAGGRACISGFLEEDWDTAGIQRETERLGFAFARFGSSVISAATYGDALQEIVTGTEEGRYREILDRVFDMTEIAAAHEYMEANRAAGKVVVVTS